MYTAMSAAATSTALAPASVAGSAGVRPKSSDLTQRKASHATGSPIRMPIETRRTARASTIVMTRCRCAPSAMRMPSSFVRRATV